MATLPPTAENFRTEMARYKLKREDVCSLIGMNANLLTMLLNEGRPMPHWAAHNIGYGINRATGQLIFAVSMVDGLLRPTRRPPHRDPRRSVVLPTKPRRRRRRQTA
jgi:hypothetical protein